MVKDTTALNLTITDTKHIAVIDSLRGFAAVIVCIFHLVCLPLGFLENTLIYDLAPYGKLGVQIFFVITGVVIPISLIKGKYKYPLFDRFILKRIVRIEPPYIFTIIAGILFILVRNYFLTKTPYDIPSAKSLLLHLGYLIPFVAGQKWFVIVFWTMAVEFQFYILISLIFPLLANKKFAIRLTSYCIIFGLALTFSNTEFVPRWLPVFMIGIVYVNFIFKKINQLEFWVLQVVSFGLSFFLLGFAIALISASTILVIHFFSKYQSKVGNFLGNISYSLYLTHTIFGTAAINFFVPHVSNLYLKLLVILLGFIVSIIAGYLFNWIVEKPFQKLASKIPLQPQLVNKEKAIHRSYKKSDPIQSA